MQIKNLQVSWLRLRDVRQRRGRGRLPGGEASHHRRENGEMRVKRVEQNMSDLVCPPKELSLGTLKVDVHCILKIWALVKSASCHLVLTGILYHKIVRIYDNSLTWSIMVGPNYGPHNPSAA